MAAYPSHWMAIAGQAVVAFVFAVGAVVVCVSIISGCTSDVKEWWQSRGMRLFRLGGVTTLRRRLSYRCTLCQDSMEAGEKVRTLSCNHVFHCGGSVKCEDGIDEWLLPGEAMAMRSCPFCREVPRPVPLWKQPPPSSPAPSPSPSASTSTTDLGLGDPLLHSAHDETLPDASSSSPASLASPLAQSPQTSTPDLEEGSPLLAHDEIRPDVSSSP